MDKKTSVFDTLPWVVLLIGLLIILYFMTEHFFQVMGKDIDWGNVSSFV